VFARVYLFAQKKNRWLGEVMPDIAQVLKAIAAKHGETIQVHGAEAARALHMSTQIPMIPVYYTSGSSRDIVIGELTVRFVHTSDARKLQCAGTRVGLALVALWYLGQQHVDHHVIARVRDALSAQEFSALQTLSMPLWMKQAIDRFSDPSSS
jgi:hypothetical protein